MNRKEALIEGGLTRFRPVILTAVTTALGLIPLAIGLNFNFFGLYTALNPELFWGGEQAAWWRNMAIAVIVGIMFATVLTLIVVPVMYSLVDDFADFFRKHFVGGAQEGLGDITSTEPTHGSGRGPLVPGTGGKSGGSESAPGPASRPEPALRRNPASPRHLASDHG